MTTSTKPLEAPGQSPEFAKAIETKNEFTEFCRLTRLDTGRSDLAVTRTIVSAWDTANATIAAQWQQLQGRRQARVDELRKTVPVGPNIPAGSSPADVAVLQQAFRVALDRARAADSDSPAQTIAGSVGGGLPIEGNPTTLRGLLADAEEFDDDSLRRAVLTAALERGHAGLVRDWTDKMGITAQLDELDGLTDTIAGHSLDHMFDVQAFTPIKKPDEAWQLTSLEQAAHAAAQARAGMR